MPRIREVAVGLHRGEDRREGEHQRGPAPPAARGRPSQRTMAATTGSKGMPEQAVEGAAAPARRAHARRRARSAPRRGPRPARAGRRTAGAARRRAAAARRAAAGEGRTSRAREAARAASRQLAFATGEAQRGRSASPSSARVASGQPRVPREQRPGRTRRRVAPQSSSRRGARLAHLGEQHLGAELVLGEDHLHLAVRRAARDPCAGPWPGPRPRGRRPSRRSSRGGGRGRPCRCSRAWGRGGVIRRIGWSTCACPASSSGSPRRARRRGRRGRRRDSAG